MFDVDSDLAAGDPKKIIPFQNAKLTNAYYFERVPKKKKLLFGRRVDLNIKEEEVPAKLQEWECRLFERPPQYVPFVEADSAVFFYLPKAEDRLIVLAYAWPFEFRTAWLTWGGKSIQENKGVMFNLESIKKDYAFNWRKFDGGSGELLEDYSLGDEGFRLLYKKPLERVATQEETNEAMRNLRKEWSMFSGGRYPGY